MGVIPFLVKTAEHSVWCGQVHALVTHHAMGQHVERISKKNSLKPNVASHNNASWYTDTDGFLEHTPSGGCLYYKRPTLLLFWEVPPCIWVLFSYLFRYSMSFD